MLPAQHMKRLSWSLGLASAGARRGQESFASKATSCAAPPTRFMYGHPFGLSPFSVQLQPQSQGADHDVGPGSPDDRQELFRRPLWGQRRELVEEEVSHVCHICHLLGSGISPKTQHGPNVHILGIVFDFDRGCLGVKQDRRTRLIDELHEILSTSQLSPGRAGKLKGETCIRGGTLFWEARDEPSWVRLESASVLRPARRTSSRTSGTLSGHGFGFSSPMLP